MWCLFCFTNETLNLCQLPEWEDEYKFTCGLLGIKIDPKFKSIPLCDECLLLFRNFGNLLEELCRVQKQIREAKKQLNEKIEESESVACMEVAVQSISKQQTPARGRTSVSTQQLKSVLDFRKSALMRMHITERKTQSNHTPSVGTLNTTRVHGDSMSEVSNREVDQFENLLRDIDTIGDFDCQYFDNIDADPDWSEPGVQSKSSPRRLKSKIDSRSPAQETTATRKRKLAQTQSEEKPKKKKKTGTSVSSQRKVRNNENNQEYPLQEDGTKSWKPRRLRLLPSLTKHPFKCSICTRGFQFRHLLKGHIAVHSGQQNFLCHLCNQRFRSRGTLGKHNTEVHGVLKPYKCLNCDAAYVMKTGLDRHRHSCFSRGVISEDEFAKLSCGKCPSAKPFSRRKFLVRHYRVHHMPPQGAALSLSCMFCSRNYKSRGRLLKHLQLHCKDESSNGFKCNECDVEFPSAILLISHIYLHGNAHQQCNECFVCNIKFITRDTYYNHNEDVHKFVVEPKLECEECGLSNFVSMSHLNFHKKMHNINVVRTDSSELRHKCSHCSGSYVNILRHVQGVHWDQVENVVPKKCWFKGCTLQFYRKDEYDAHISLHRSRKNNIRRKSDSNFQALTRNNRKTFPCKFCGKKYGKMKYLQHHGDRDHGGSANIVDCWGPGKRNICCACHRTFDEYYEYSLHMQLIHHKVDLVLYPVRDNCSKPKLRNLKMYRKIRKRLKKLYNVSNSWKLWMTKRKKNTASSTLCESENTTDTVNISKCSEEYQKIFLAVSKKKNPIPTKTKIDKKQLKTPTVELIEVIDVIDSD